jgi:iron complex outermembrane receptor protein
MISRTILPSWQRRALLNSIAFTCLFLPVDGWSQSAKRSQTLDPVVVQPSATPPNARSIRRGTAARTARLRQ